MRPRLLLDTAPIPGGVPALCSSASDRGFMARLRRAGFAVEEAVVRAGGRGGARHVIRLAARTWPLVISRRRS